MKKILIALDYDPTAQKVAEEGYKIANSMKAEVVLLHIISDAMYYASREYSPIMGFTGFTDISQPLMNNDKELKIASIDFLEKSKSHLGDKDIKTLVKTGDKADTILEVAKEIKANIIVMESHSHKWIENVLLGSVTEKVLRHTTIPLFIIPTKKTS